VAPNIFSEPWVLGLTNQVSNELQEQVAWIKGGSLSLNTADQETKMLDYACGDGMVSRVSPPPSSSEPTVVEIKEPAPS
jgi:hypothetical protein